MLDPFSDKAKRLVKEEFGGITELLLIIPSYVGIDQALERVLWVKSGEMPRDLLEMGDIQDLLTFYALLGALAFSPYGIEMELVKEANSRIYAKRLRRAGRISGTATELRTVDAGEIPSRDRTILERTHHHELPPDERDKLRLRYKIHLGKFLELWEGSLKEVYIREGYVYLTTEQALKLWEKSFERNFERAVNLLYEVRDELPSYYLQLYERLGEIAREYFKERLERMGSAEAGLLRFELFPPCVKIALGGVPAGLRNYAITVLLTSFLSYARLCPSPSRRDVRIRDCVGDLSVVEKEILPVIIEAGNRCSPPLFEDQPHEVKNIWYHLGFGLTDKPRLEDSGNSTWYFPPNCSKIRANAPQLCKPDRHCRNIKNPLTYYLRRLYIESRKGKQSTEGGENG
ncbi:DNA primase large subunit PriL [Thermococcus thioreducens]|uniref:DNA primase large subunit PriL n=1 Tax=Thermococcus thioreducens TaxID=277988 RepID=A0A0Q2UMI1_9EURY|nr:DNA primase large subunit PriL [Thermococcus thioreducens]ASJ11526.1 DNA primase [Thermococcus thioreducens]KQH81864.1 DNA primase [Thermococcus thioreducens]SEW05118.1 DNA primase large subunit [Thermococcus thioreducens]